jgi:hypothetical protein
VPARTLKQTHVKHSATVAAEIDRGPAPHRRPDDAVDLLAVADAAAVLMPCHFLIATVKMRPGDVMMMAEFAAPQTREIGFGGIGPCSASAVGPPVVGRRRSCSRSRDRPACRRWQASQAQEQVLDPAVRHAHDLGGAEPACRCG